MNIPASSSTSCRSVFRDSDTPLTAEQYTQLWIRLINQIERSNTAAAGIQ